MSKKEDNSDNESDDEGDEVITKLIAFTYETSYLNELEIYFEPVISEKSADKQKKKKKKKKRKTDENLKFKTFLLPRWLSNDSPFSRLASDSYIFYNFNDVEKVYEKYQIVQKCNRGLISGTSYYNSNLLAVSNKVDEFLLEMKFNRNEAYSIYKNPNGKQLVKGIEKLVLI